MESDRRSDIMRTSSCDSLNLRVAIGLSEHQGVLLLNVVYPARLRKANCQLYCRNTYRSSEITHLYHSYVTRSVKS